MAWETVRLLDSSGKPVRKRHRKLILGFIEHALSNPHLDPDLLMKIARAAARDIADIHNLAAYLSRSLFRASRKANIDEQTVATQFEEISQCGKAIADRSTASIELQILIQELLEALDGLDREIYCLRLEGFKFKDIDKALSLRSRTSEYRFREAALRLRRLLDTKSAEEGCSQ